MYAAAVAPERVREFPLGKWSPKRYFSERAGQIMIAHGHSEAALEFVLQHEEGVGYPFNLANQMIGKVDGEQQLAILRRAIGAWRSDHRDGFQRDGFLHLFRSKWELLPMEEAQMVAREIIDTVLDAPDRQISSRYGDDPKIEITSAREDALFQIRNVLREVEPALTESLITAHAQLANAARRWPKGFASIREEHEARRKMREGEGRKGGGFFAFGGSDVMAYLKALRQASEDGNFHAAIQFAAEEYEEDNSAEHRNHALKASWPSSCMYCTVLYQAGRRLGEAAGSYLNRIPDPDQRLLARIELAAALAGLPEFQQTQRGFFPRGNRTQHVN